MPNTKDTLGVELDVSSNSTPTTTSTPDAVSEASPSLTTGTTSTPLTTSSPASSSSGGDSEYKFADYGIFSDAVASTTAYNASVDSVNEAIKDGNTKLSDQSIFMGPIQENCVEVFQKINTSFGQTKDNFTSIGNYLTEAAAAYKTGDTEASNVILKIDGKEVSSSGGLSGTPVSTTEIPDDMAQSGYTVTCYGEGGWYLGGGADATSVASGTKQKDVHNAWLADGARYKDGIAVMNVNGQDCYLVATSSAVGNVGDALNVTFKNGQTIPCVVADAKSSHDSNYSKYGHVQGNGSVNVLEFEVDRNVYNSKGNPTTDSWGLEWDSSSGVKTVDNYGTLV